MKCRAKRNKNTLECMYLSWHLTKIFFRNLWPLFTCILQYQAKFSSCQLKRGALEERRLWKWNYSLRKMNSIRHCNRYVPHWDHSSKLDQKEEEYMEWNYIWHTVSGNQKLLYNMNKKYIFDVVSHWDVGDFCYYSTLH